MTNTERINYWANQIPNETKRQRYVLIMKQIYSMTDMIMFLTPYHVRIMTDAGDVDFWPTTGAWRYKGTTTHRNIFDYLQEHVLCE
jgi:hypothetical protein